MDKTGESNDRKRKRKIHSLEDKFKFVKEIEKGLSQKETMTDIANRLRIPPSTLSGIWKNKAGIEDSIKADNKKIKRSKLQQPRKLFRSPKYVDVKDALFKWFNAACSTGMPITKKELTDKAESLANDKGRVGFKASSSFINNFMKNRDIQQISSNRLIILDRSWSLEYNVLSKDYGVAEYHQKLYGQTLPRFVMVRQGYSGDVIQDIFDKGQILRLHTVSKQKRVIARFMENSERRLITIPISYQYRMCVLDKNGKPGQEKTLEKILDEHELPVSIQFPRGRTIQHGNLSISSKLKIELVQTFIEKCFLANHIVGEQLVSDVKPVPLYLKQLRLAEITGFKKQSQEKWQAYIDQIDQDCSKLHYDTRFGISEIAVYDPSSNYEHIKNSSIEPKECCPMKPAYGKPNSTIRSEDGLGVNEQNESTPRASTSSESTPKASTSSESTPKASTSSESTPKTSTSSESAPKASTSSKTTPKASTPSESAPKASTSSKTTPKASTPSESAPKASTSSKTTPKASTSSKTTPKAGTSSKSAPTADTRPSTNQLQSLESQDAVKRLKIDELSKYLEALGLGEYVDKFKNNRIDGSILCDLKEEILEQKFDFDTVEAIILMKFAKTGHIPS